MKKTVLMLILSITLISPLYGFKKQILAVMRLKSKTSGIDTDALTELLQTELVKKKSTFIIVERNRLNDVIKEQQMLLSGMTEDEQAVKIGELVGAEKILIGTVSYWSGRYVLNVKAIDSSSGVVDFADSVMSYKPSGLIDIIPVLARRIEILARGGTVRMFQLPSKSNKNGYWKNLLKDPTKHFAYDIDFGFASINGIPKASFYNIGIGFKAPGESFLQIGGMFHIGIGSISTNVNILRFSFSPTLQANFLRTRLGHAGIGIGYDLAWNNVRKSESLFTDKKLSFNTGSFNFFAEAGLMFDRNWSLNISWKYSIPVASNMKSSSLSASLEDELGLDVLRSRNGIGVNSFSLILRLFR